MSWLVSADRLELGVLEEVGLVDDQHRGAAAFGLFDSQGVGGLRDEGGVVGQGLPAEGEHDLVVDAPNSDGGVGQVDDAVPGGVQCGERGADGDGFPGADFPGDHADAALGDAPADAGDGFAVAGVAVQHSGCQVPTEGGVGEPEESLQAIGHVPTCPSSVASRSSCSGSVVVSGVGVVPVRAA
jgi:hypothetical protein